MKPRMSSQKLGENKNPQVVWCRPRDFVIYLEPIEYRLNIEVLYQSPHLTSAKVRKVFETTKFQLLQNIVKK